MATNSLRPCGRNLAAAVVSEIGDSTAVKVARMRIAADVHNLVCASHTRRENKLHVLLVPTSYTSGE
jgi:hypothetical protein